jgi:hypothetical protein
MLVFVAEMASGLDAQIEVGERILRACPGHRNGRRVLATYLCKKAVVLMDLRLDTAGPTTRQRAKDMVARAAELNPHCELLDKARASVGRDR